MEEELLRGFGGYDEGVADLEVDGLDAETHDQTPLGRADLATIQHNLPVAPLAMDGSPAA